MPRSPLPPAPRRLPPLPLPPGGRGREAGPRARQRAAANDRPGALALSPVRAGAVLARLPENVQVDVIHRLVDLEETDPEILREVEETLRSRLSQQVEMQRRRVAGLQAVAGILKATDGRVGMQILDNLASRDRALAEKLGPRSVDVRRPGRLGRGRAGRGLRGSGAGADVAGLVRRGAGTGQPRAGPPTAGRRPRDPPEARPSRPDPPSRRGRSPAASGADRQPVELSSREQGAGSREQCFPLVPLPARPAPRSPLPEPHAHDPPRHRPEHGYRQRGVQLRRYGRPGEEVPGPGPHGRGQDRRPGPAGGRGRPRPGPGPRPAGGPGRGRPDDPAAAFHGHPRPAAGDPRHPSGQAGLAGPVGNGRHSPGGGNCQAAHPRRVDAAAGNPPDPDPRGPATGGRQRRTSACC